jgi:HD superfamily phosphodiesterase
MSFVSDFLQQVRQAMEGYFGADARRIAHALQVTAYAEELLAYIDADPTVTLSAAYLHDIGIPDAERIHGSCAGPYQEELGPPVAGELLSGLGAPAALVETVCAIIGRHHTPGGVDSPEFRILWDADALVNLEEVVPGKSPEDVRAILDKWLVTEPGYRRARSLYLS